MMDLVKKKLIVLRTYVSFKANRSNVLRKYSERSTIVLVKETYKQPSTMT